MQHHRATTIIRIFRSEINIIIGVLITIITLPVFAILGLMKNGIQEASDAFVHINPITHEVEIRDITGKLTRTLTASTTWPINGTITQEFGHPNPPYQKAHTGIDIDGGLGSPVTVFMRGRVIETGDEILAGCGSHCVIVDHGHEINSIYAHMSAHSVRVGQMVEPGYVIGFEGAEGWASGAHLHFEIQIAHIPVNPRTFIIGDPAN